MRAKPGNRRTVNGIDLILGTYRNGKTNTIHACTTIHVNDATPSIYIVLRAVMDRKTKEAET